MRPLSQALAYVKFTLPFSVCLAGLLWRNSRYVCISISPPLMYVVFCVQHLYTCFFLLLDSLCHHRPFLSASTMCPKEARHAGACHAHYLLFELSHTCLCCPSQLCRTCSWCFLCRICIRCMGVMQPVMDRHGLHMSNDGGIGHINCCVQQGHHDFGDFCFLLLFAAKMMLPM